MDLKNFHVLFIMASIVVALGFGLWCFFTEAGTAVAGSTVIGTISVIVAAALVIYAVVFLKKMGREGTW